MSSMTSLPPCLTIDRWLLVVGLAACGRTARPWKKSSAKMRGIHWRSHRLSIPEGRARLLEPPAQPHCGYAAGEPARIIGLDRERAQRRLAHRRLEARGGDLAQEPGQRLALVHADHRIVVAGHAEIGHE